MSVLNINTCIDGSLPERQKDLNINWMLIDFINEKKKTANLTNKELSKLFVTNNPNKLERALDDFDRTGYLNPNYLKWLGGILGFTPGDIRAIEKKYSSLKDEYRSVLYKDRSVFIENFPLLLKYSDLVTGVQEYSNITFNGLVIAGTFVSRRRPLTLGELFIHYRHGRLLDDRGCCGKVYLFFAVGSVLSGGYRSAGVCSRCNSLVYSSESSFRRILSDFLSFKTELEYCPSRIGITDLVEHLLLLEQQSRSGKNVPEIKTDDSLQSP